MRIFELEKPKTPEQLKLDQLRATSKRASDALKIERDRQHHLSLVLPCPALQTITRAFAGFAHRSSKSHRPAFIRLTALLLRKHTV